MKRGEILEEGMRVIVTSGRCAGRPGIVTEVRGSACSVELANGNEAICKPGALRVMTQREQKRYESMRQICGE